MVGKDVGVNFEKFRYIPRFHLNKLFHVVSSEISINSADVTKFISTNYCTCPIFTFPYTRLLYKFLAFRFLRPLIHITFREIYIQLILRHFIKSSSSTLFFFPLSLNNSLFKKKCRNRGRRPYRIIYSAIPIVYTKGSSGFPESRGEMRAGRQKRGRDEIIKFAVRRSRSRWSAIRRVTCRSWERSNLVLRWTKYREKREHEDAAHAFSQVCRLLLFELFSLSLLPERRKVTTPARLRIQKLQDVTFLGTESHRDTKGRNDPWIESRS